MSLDVRFLAEAERPHFHRTIVRAFGHDYSPDPEKDARFEASFDNDLCIGAFDGDDLVGTFASFDLHLNVPGGQVSMAGTTVVSVMPTHRRRGLLTRMMDLHLQQAVDRGQPVAGLWATDVGIYGRFGYGPASEVWEASFDTRKSAVTGPEPGVDLRFMTTDEAATIAPPIFAAAIASTPGTYARPDWWWKHRVLPDPEEFREGMSEHRWVVAEANGEPVGYVLYRTKLDWESEGANGKVSVIELHATTDAARRALWHYLSTIDLFPRVDYWNLPSDDVLPWLMSDPRQLKYSTWEALWLRILDIPAALEARSYAADGSVVLGIDDPFRPANSGSYELSVDSGTASVLTVDAPPDVTMPVDVLGSIYLGHHDPLVLHRANRLRGSTQGVELLGNLVRWPVSAWTHEIF